ncbi:kinase-like domain-containing protein [Hygrophoropsis aurantiaca]|uniref:Kinase-like domain-containing protein n=1 Tax=Hygrophoropsis aurantiaca TaxID=72124 RepID=A0ACB8AJT1_9AGAM|nr:kinase-like domain-containing protein [Hygrophoropsis aurantiaca]
MERQQHRQHANQTEHARNVAFAAPVILPLKVNSSRYGPSPTTSPVDLTGSLQREDKYPAAHGGFGDIWKCFLKTESKLIPVAVKALRPHVSSEEDRRKKSKRLQRELSVWQRLRHENVLPLLGVTSGFGPFTSMICPWLDNGTLTTYLERYQKKLANMDRFLLLTEIASGLRYLHSNSVIHGDLTGSNVLIDHNGSARLADFGLSIAILEFQGTSNLTSCIRGAVRWAAPELYDIRGNGEIPRPTTRIDIYSFGSIMLQVLSGKVPYYYLKNDAQVLIELSREIVPKRPTNLEIADLYWDFIQRCWSTYKSGAHRPTMDEIVHFVNWHHTLSNTRTVINITFRSSSRRHHGSTTALQMHRRVESFRGEIETAAIYPALVVALEYTHERPETVMGTLALLLKDLCDALKKLIGVLYRWVTRDTNQAGVSDIFVCIAEDVEVVAQILEMYQYTDNPRSDLLPCILLKYR